MIWQKYSYEKPPEFLSTLRTHSVLSPEWIWTQSPPHLFSICQCVSEVIIAWLRGTLAGCGATKLWINTLWSLTVKPIKMYAIQHYLWRHARLSTPRGESWVWNDSECIRAPFAVFNDSPGPLFLSPLRSYSSSFPPLLVKIKIRHAYHSFLTCQS